MRPLVLVTADRREGGPPPPDAPRVRPLRAEVYVNEVIVAHLRAAGARVLLVPPGESAIDELVSLAAGVVITGGAHDIHPRHYGQEVRARLGRVDEARTVLELALARACVVAGTPLLGVCGGMQAMVVAAGGALVQDIGTQVPGAIDHEQPTDPATPAHALLAWGPLAGRVPNAVNSTHHQCVDDPGPYEVCARAPDGVVEAVSLPGHPYAVGVQWHPELVDARVYDDLVAAARRAR